MTCPPLIDLSRFVDAELDAPGMIRVAEHVDACDTCRRSVAELESTAAVQGRDEATAATADCPSSERLLAYLTAADAAEHSLDAHLDRCDHCVVALQRLQRSVASIAEMPTLVPAQVRERATGKTPLAAPRPAPAAPRESLWQRLLSGWRYPVLMPTAFAMGMLLYVIALQLPLTPGLPPVASRAVVQPGPVTRRVSVPEAWVYSEPRPTASVVAKLSRGNPVDVSSEERGWYRVLLADGRAGWIEGQSLQ